MLRKLVSTFVFFAVLCVALVLSGCADASTNSAFVAPAYAPGTTQGKVASFVVTAPFIGNGELSGVTLSVNAPGLKAQNMIVKADGQPFGTARATVGETEAALTFSASKKIEISSGGSIIVDVYEDILTSSTSGSYPSAIKLTNWQMSGGLFGLTTGFPGVVSGQDVHPSPLRSSPSRLHQQLRRRRSPSWEARWCRS